MSRKSPEPQSDYGGRAMRAPSEKPWQNYMVLRSSSVGGEDFGLAVGSCDSADMIIKR